MTWRPLGTAVHREVSGSSLAAWALKDVEEVNPGRADEEKDSHSTPGPGVGVQGTSLPGEAVIPGSTAPLYNSPTLDPQRVRVMGQGQGILFSSCF